LTEKVNKIVRCPPKLSLESLAFVLFWVVDARLSTLKMTPSLAALTAAYNFLMPLDATDQITISFPSIHSHFQSCISELYSLLATVLQL
jgi:hypothetical protein